MSKRHFLDFEQPVSDLESKIEELRYVQNESAVDISEEIDRLGRGAVRAGEAQLGDRGVAIACPGNIMQVRTEQAIEKCVAGYLILWRRW